MRHLPPLDKASLETKRGKAQQGQGNMLRARPRSETRGEERSRAMGWRSAVQEPKTMTRFNHLPERQKLLYSLV